MKKKHMLSFWILALFSAIYLFPIGMAFLNSFKTQQEIYQSVLAPPAVWSFENYAYVFREIEMVEGLLNSFAVTIVGIGGIVIFGALAGYKLSRTNTKCANIIFLCFVASMLVPFQAIMVALTQMANKLHFQNSLMGLGIIYIGMGVSMSIFLFHGFVKSIPIELEEAAFIDGCTPLKTFFCIIFPLLKPVSVTVIVTNVFWVWNDFLLPLLILVKNDKYTLVLKTTSFYGQYVREWPYILVSLIVTSIPVLLLFIGLQKHIIEGIVAGAVKS